MVFGKEKKVKRDWNRVEKCCDCGGEIEIKYNRGTKTWSQKNNIEFWSKKLKDRGKYKCDSCWLTLYYRKPQEFSELVHPDTRSMFYNYAVNNGWFGEWETATK